MDPLSTDSFLPPTDIQTYITATIEILEKQNKISIFIMSFVFCFNTKKLLYLYVPVRTRSPLDKSSIILALPPAVWIVALLGKHPTSLWAGAGAGAGHPR